MRKLTYNVPVSNYRNLENWIHRKLAEAGEGGGSSEVLPPPEDGIMLPDKVYRYDFLAENTEFHIQNEIGLYHWIFSVDGDITITWPSGIVWANDSQPTIEKDYIYEVSIYNTLAVFAAYPIKLNPTR